MTDKIVGNLIETSNEAAGILWSVFTLLPACASVLEARFCLRGQNGTDGRQHGV